MSKTVTHMFTFGSAHMTSFPLPRGGTLGDYWVAVELPENFSGSHRAVFMDEFTRQYCPTPTQFSFEYHESHFQESYFPGGELHRIVRNEG